MPDKPKTTDILESDVSAGKPKAKVGRPSDRTPLRRRRVLASLSRFAQKKVAAAAVKKSYAWLNDWINDDPAFAAEVDIAENSSEGVATDVLWEVMTSTTVEPRVRKDAAIELLKRRRRKDWGDHISIEDFDPEALSDEDLEKAAGTGTLRMVG